MLSRARSSLLWHTGRASSRICRGFLEQRLWFSCRSSSSLEAVEHLRWPEMDLRGVISVLLSISAELSGKIFLKSLHTRWRKATGPNKKWSTPWIVSCSYDSPFHSVYRFEYLCIDAINWASKTGADLPASREVNAQKRLKLAAIWRRRYPLKNPMSLALPNILCRPLKSPC